MPLMISKLSNAHEIEVSNKTITQEWPYIDWPHREGVCILWLFFDMVACTASIWNLVIIAFDRFLVRYVSIHNDRHHTNNTKIAILFNLIINSTFYFRRFRCQLNTWLFEDDRQC